MEPLRAGRRAPKVRFEVLDASLLPKMRDLYHFLNRSESTTASAAAA